MPVDVIEKPARKTRAELSAEHDKKMSELSDEQLQEQQKSWMQTFGYPVREKKKEAEKKAETPAATQTANLTDETKPTKEDEKPAKEKEATKPDDTGSTATAPKNLNDDAPEVPPDDTEDADALAEKVSERVATKLKPAETEKKDPLADLSPDDKEIIRTVQQLSREPQFKGKDLVKQTLDYWKKEEEYSTQWEKDHPGESFDPADEEHADFYAKINPEYSDSDLARARKAVETEEIERRAEERALKRVQPQLDEIRLERAAQVAAPKIAQSRATAVVELAAKAVPEFEPILKEHGLSKDGITKMHGLNSVAVEILDEEAGPLKIKIEELGKLEHLGQFFQPNMDLEVQTPDGQIVMPYKDILRAGESLETRIQAQPKDQQIYEGRMFLPRSEMSARVNAIHQSHDSNEAKQAKLKRLFDRHWSIEISDIRDYLIADSARRVKKQLGRIGSVAKQSTASPSNNGQTTTQKTATSTAPNPPASVAASSSAVNTKLPGSQPDVSREQFLAKMRGS